MSERLPSASNVLIPSFAFQKITARTQLLIDHSQSTMYWSRCAILGFSASIALVHAAPQAIATPSASAASGQATAVPHAWDHGATDEFPIHASCNATETRMLRKALAEAVELAEHATRHVLRWGNSSAHYQKYFGNAPTGEVIGWLQKIVRGDRSRTLFRCDNPDGNCALPGNGSPIQNPMDSIKASMLTTPRLGRALARSERHRRDSHLPALVRDT